MSIAIILLQFKRKCLFIAEMRESNGSVTNIIYFSLKKISFIQLLRHVLLYPLNNYIQRQEKDKCLQLFPS